MKYSDFERIMSVPRMNRYVTACSNNTRKAMALYRLNLKLSQELAVLRLPFVMRLIIIISQFMVMTG